jgi:serine/threonine-protein kinase
MGVPTAKSLDRIGDVIAARYRLDEIIGRGGIGVVYGGTHVVTERAIAVKVLHARFAENETNLQRFILEAKAAARLNHPNVVDVIDLGKSDDGTVYMVLERLRGEALSQRLKFEGALGEQETFALLTPVMDAVAAAHRANILHRDLKPGNIFVHRDSNDRVVPKLLDFGLAKILDGDDPGLTSEGARLGTYHYMSPEQARAERTIGPETDVWSMGVVLYQCLTGQLPFAGPDPVAIIKAIETGDHVPLGDRDVVARPVADAIERALEVDRTRRYRDMGELATALAGARSGASAVASSSPVDEFGGDTTTTRSPMPDVARAHSAPKPVERAVVEPKHKPLGGRHVMAALGLAGLFLSMAILVAAPSDTSPIEVVEVPVEQQQPSLEPADPPTLPEPEVEAVEPPTIRRAVEVPIEAVLAQTATEALPPPVAAAPAPAVQRVPSKKRGIAPAPRVRRSPPKKAGTSGIIREW